MIDLIEDANGEEESRTVARLDRPGRKLGGSWCIGIQGWFPGHVAEAAAAASESASKQCPYDDARKHFKNTGIITGGESAATDVE